MQIINKAYHKVQSSKFKVQSKMKALTKTDFHFDGQKSVYHGKVRDVYDITTTSS